MKYRLLMFGMTALSFAASPVVSAFATECELADPDSLQISWTSPCEDGSWIRDPQVGCRLWDWRPAAEDSATWSGRCLSGLKQGAGTVQWFEHGRPIDLFEGKFEHGQRAGFGRYEWPAGQHFEGHYDADMPNGWGTVTIDGTAFTGLWRHGCLVHEGKTIAIAARLSSCPAASKAVSP